MDDMDGVLASMVIEDDVIGLVVPSSEDYGVIETADPKLKYVTVPAEDVDMIRRGLTREDKNRMIDQMVDRIRAML